MKARLQPLSYLFQGVKKELSAKKIIFFCRFDHETAADS
jgi:hypothetical protein